MRRIVSKITFLIGFTLSACLLFISTQIFATDSSTETSNAQSVVRFAVPNFPPYIYLNDEHKLTGLGINRVEKVLDKMDITYQFNLVENYGVAINQMRTGQIDGFFLATQNRYRDRIAKISDSVLINNWSWFYKKNASLNIGSDEFKKHAKIGTLLNTNTQVWLQDNDYTIATLSNDVETLVDMLLKGRLDAVFLSESVFLYALASHPEERRKIANKTQSSRDFSVYFSNEFIARHRWFLDSFNGELAKLKASEQKVSN